MTTIVKSPNMIRHPAALFITNTERAAGKTTGSVCLHQGSEREASQGGTDLSESQIYSNYVFV